MTVYFVDEDYGRFDPWLMELTLRGMRAEALGDADTAYLRLTSSDDIELAIIDVMLSARPNESRYDANRTDDYLQTGLCLVRDLALDAGPAFPRRAVLLTNAVSSDILRAAEQLSRELHIPFWQKIQIVSPFEFGEMVTRHITLLADESKQGRRAPRG